MADASEFDDTGRWSAMGRMGRALAAAAVLLLGSALLTGTAASTPLRPARAVAPTGRWGRAEAVTGLETLNAGGDAAVNSLSCSSAGNCAAGGVFEDSFHRLQAFVVDEVNGTWGSAEEVPRTGWLNAGGDAQVYWVSCGASAGCAAGGVYEDARDHLQAFVVNEVNGTWGVAEEVPRTGALNAGGRADVNSLSCTSDGGCAAGGTYEDPAGHDQAFFVNEVNGRWRKAAEVPGTGALNAGGDASLNSVTCTSVGNCAAGGGYEDGSGHDQAFVVDEVNGSWGDAEEVPGTAVLNAGGYASVNSVSCVSAGNCWAGGVYEDGSGHEQAFVVDEVNGSWGDAEEVPGTAALNAGGYAYVNSVSCLSAGNCTAGGYYEDSSGAFQAFVVDDVKGSWSTAEEVPGTAALNAGGSAYVNSVSCLSTGDCAAVGAYSANLLVVQPFVADEMEGIWGRAVEVPGTAALNSGGDAEVDAVACVPPGYCAAGGDYLDSSSRYEAFVVDYSEPPSVTGLSPRHGPTAGGTMVRIFGRNLLGPMVVRFGTKVARIDKVVSATVVEVRSPKGSGTVAVTLTTAAGTSTTTPADRFRY